jgi:hypothetical protein
MAIDAYRRPARVKPVQGNRLQADPTAEAGFRGRGGVRLVIASVGVEAAAASLAIPALIISGSISSGLL